MKIDFSNTEESRSNRISYRDIESKYSTYYRKVFQMMGAIKSNGLGGMAQSHGTGFFIDKRGYALTNLHVLNENPQCVLKRSCSIDIKKKSNQVETFNVSLRVLTCSKRNDFCLIKINIPKELIIENFELDLNTISKNLMTVGFPGDKERDFETVEAQVWGDVKLSDVDYFLVNCSFSKKITLKEAINLEVKSGVPVHQCHTNTSHTHLKRGEHILSQTNYHTH